VVLTATTWRVRTEGASEADFRLRTAIFPVKRCAEAERATGGRGRHVVAVRFLRQSMATACRALVGSPFFF